MRRALAAAVAGVLLVPGVLLADDAVPTATQPPPSTAPAAAPVGGGAAAAGPADTQTPTQTQQAHEDSKVPAPVVTAAKKESRPKKDPKVHAAGAGSVTIQNFAFAPATVNVNAGDTVTWTNRDSATHTATGNGGSFNTGVLKKGQSASHTFSKAGRFAYICAIHPNMHGTVVVAGAAAAAPSSSPGSPATPAATKAQSGPTLPNTGLQIAVVALLGALFTGCGTVLRWLGQRSDHGV